MTWPMAALGAAEAPPAADWSAEPIELPAAEAARQKQDEGSRDGWPAREESVRRGRGAASSALGGLDALREGDQELGVVLLFCPGAA